ncbi:uncharacterized protein CLUP02_09077 [Colletotrichum lupini]|uniref:Uncharacterized protein n=1 Tax=Colletotrichum lupini TaxID=145971 RepID=A0A9Q8SUQ6_9PEZI|nr:uncharacterized protein CLUP02_09077 [Colletotrichum lupini]UQC83583.1 hypothetical protein CLUP02_09077 [Colletotrichum lupini]
MPLWDATLALSTSCVGIAKRQLPEVDATQRNVLGAVSLFFIPMTPHEMPRAGRFPSPVNQNNIRPECLLLLPLNPVANPEYCCN